MAITLQGNGLSTFSNNITSTTGDLTLGDGNLVVADGHGIDFHPQGASNANLLDDYEEGSWTPTLSIGTATATRAFYTRIGKLVHVSAQLYDFSNRTSSDPVQINSLPFAPAAPQACGTMMGRNIDVEAFCVYVNSDPSLLCYRVNPTAGFANLRHNHLNGADTDMYVFASYMMP